jgi:hypothetical protein
LFPRNENADLLFVYTKFAKIEELVSIIECTKIKSKAAPVTGSGGL